MRAHPVLDPGIPLSKYRYADLSVSNPDLREGFKDVGACQAYLDRVLQREGGAVAWGGYLERRNLYQGFTHFNPAGATRREYHLGLDFWAPGGTGVYAPWKGTVHSWGHLRAPGDYGPVIILEHILGGSPLFALYGHLSPESLHGLYPGKPVGAGQQLGWLGAPRDNGGYAPHLHFQLIRDLQGCKGDYPGVCASAELSLYSHNCPNPMEWLGYF